MHSGLVAKLSVLVGSLALLAACGDGGGTAARGDTGMTGAPDGSALADGDAGPDDATPADPDGATDGGDGTPSTPDTRDGEGLGDSDTDATLVVNDSPLDVGDRSVRVIVPPGYTPEQRWPLVLLLHGFGVNGTLQGLVFDLRQRAEADGFLAAIPEGDVDSRGRPFWNATPECCDNDDTGVDHVAYLEDVLDAAQERFNVDPDRVFVVGHSNGGFMAYRLACDLAPRIRGIVSLAGAPFADADLCLAPDGATAVLQAHGTEDSVLDYDRAAEPAARRWAARNGCADEPTVLDPADYLLNIDGAESPRLEWRDCALGGTVALWTLEGGEHIPALTDRFNEDLFAWLLALRPKG